MFSLTCCIPNLSVPVYSGIEDLHYVAYVLGAQGVISDLGTAFPAEASERLQCVRQWETFGCHAAHERLVRLWRALGHGPESEGRVRSSYRSARTQSRIGAQSVQQDSIRSQHEVRNAMGHEGLQLA